MASKAKDGIENIVGAGAYIMAKETNKLGIGGIIVWHIARINNNKVAQTRMSA